MGKLAIVVIAYNRVNSLARLLNSLNKINVPTDEKITLYISIDRAKNENIKNKEVVEYANNFKWNFGEKIVDFKKENMGLRKHILQCGNLTNIYENIIVLEDDLVVSPLVYKYACQVIDYYKEDDNIAGFGLYSFQRNPLNNLPFYPLKNGSDVYFMQYACSWGQIWTKSRWNDFYKWYEQNKDNDFSNDLRIPQNLRYWGDNSWLKYHIIYTISKNKYFVYPYYGLTTNFSESGTHNKTTSIAYQNYMYYNDINEINFKFSNFQTANVLYDAFFENANLKDLLKNNNDIIADLYTSKSKELISMLDGYLLSTQIYDYKVIDSFSLQMYPYELNILNKIKGTDIFLYDKSIKEKNNIKYKRYILLKYIYKLDFLSRKDMKSITKLFMNNIKNAVIRRLKK